MWKTFLHLMIGGLAVTTLAQTNTWAPATPLQTTVTPTTVTPTDPYARSNDLEPKPPKNQLPPPANAREVIRKGFWAVKPVPPAPRPAPYVVPPSATTTSAPVSSASLPPILFNTPDADAIVSKLTVFPADNPWNADVSRWPRHPLSDDIIDSMGQDAPFRCNRDMGYILIPPSQPKVPVTVTPYFGESDRGPYPVPENVPIEGWPLSPAKATLDEVQRDTRNLGGDRHAIIVDPVNRMLYEFFAMKRTPNGWQAAQASIFDLKSNKLRPAGWTSADAAGLPIFPAIVRYDEIQRGIVGHAMRVTARRTQRAYVAPATHYASRLTDPRLPRMGERIRLRQEVDISRFSYAVQAILKGLKKHGMFVADNGINWAISVAPDERIPDLHAELRQLRGRDFEVVVAP